MTVVAARPIAELLTGFGPEAAVDAAATALPWMVVAGLGQFTAGLLASTLAALDDYVVPALAFISGSLAGLVLLLVRIDENGTEAVAWGMALNAVLATTLMAVWLWTRARSERMPAGAARVDVRGSAHRLRELGSGASLPFALQAIYLVCLPIAAREGRRLGDELRLRVPDRGRRRRHQRLVARAGHRRAIDPDGPGASARRAPRRGVGLARAAPRGGDCGDLRGRRRRDRGTGPRRRLRRRRRGPDRPPRRRDGAVHGGVGRAVGHLPARVRRGPREPVARDRARRAGDPRARGARRSGGRGPRRPRARARGVDGARVRLDADATPRGPLDDGAARGRGRRRGGVRALRVRARRRAARARRRRWWSASLLATGALALVRPVGLRSAWHYLRELA